MTDPVAPTSDRHGNRLVNYALLAFMGTTWGSSFLFNAISLQTITPITLAASRVLIATILLIGVAVLTGLRFPRDRRTWILLMTLAVTSHIAPFVLISFGQQRIDSSLAAILISAVPIFTLLIAHVFTEDRITPSKAIGVFLGFTGIVLLIGGNALGELGGEMGRGLWGQLMIIGAALGFAITTVIARGTRHLNPVISTSGSLLFSSAVLVPAALLIEAPWKLTPSLLSMGSVLGVAVFSTSLAVLAFFRLTKTAGPNFVSMNIYIAPMVGVLWGVALLGEPLGYRRVFALAIILAGIAVATGILRPPRRTSAKETAE